MREPDIIAVTGIRAVGTVGLLPEERERAQPLEVDLEIEVDVRGAGADDDLERSVDYGLATTIAAETIERERHLLLERVATRIAEQILALPRVEGVTVVVKKLRPPVPHDVASSSVRIRRRRPDLVRRTRPVVAAYVALGTNLGDRMGHLRFAVSNLPDVRTMSGVYETDPVGGPDDQGPYLNMVVEVETRLDPFGLLEVCRSIELAAGRERKQRWGARTLDLDILLFGSVRLDSDDLTIPHPRMWERRFVLAPLAEIAPNHVPTDWERRLAPAGIQRIGDLEL